jgi:hypothetical protein
MHKEEKDLAPFFFREKGYIALLEESIAPRCGNCRITPHLA